MKVISEASQYVLTEYGSYRLKYELQEYEFSEEGEPEICYGIRICQIEEKSRLLYDVCQISGITEDKEAAGFFFSRIVEGLVMPVSLPELIEDWQAALSVI